MRNIISSFVREFIKVIIIVAIAVPTIALFAWSGPTGAPPTNNADAPVNVGSVDQIKTYETDGLGNLIPGKAGGLGVGVFFSRFGTLLATDGGNVGIGQRDWKANPPQAKLHVSGGDALFEGRVQIQGGLPEKDKVLVAADNTGFATWGNVTADMLIPQGYEEVFTNGSEDIYANWTMSPNPSDLLLPACDRNNGILGVFFSEISGVYTCSPEENRICLDSTAVQCPDRFMCDRIFGPGGPIMHRKVECRAAKALRKDAWKYVDHKYTGKALIVDIDRHGSSESCVVKVNFSNTDGSYSCSNSGFLVRLGGSYSLPGCEDQLLRHIQRGDICRLPFQDRIKSFNGAWDAGGLEGGGTGALDLNFTEIK